MNSPVNQRTVASVEFRRYEFDDTPIRIPAEASFGGDSLRAMCKLSIDLRELRRVFEEFRCSWFELSKLEGDTIIAVAHYERDDLPSLCVMKRECVL